MRFRTTAFPTERGTTRPTRGGPGCPGALTSTMPPLRRLVPAPRTLRKSFGVRRDSGRETLSALVTPSLEDGAARTRAHAMTEAVTSLATPHFGLIGAFHEKEESVRKREHCRLRVPENLCQSVPGRRHTCGRLRARLVTARGGPCRENSRSSRKVLEGNPGVRGLRGAVVEPGKRACDLGIHLWTGWPPVIHSIDSRVLDERHGRSDTRSTRRLGAAATSLPREGGDNPALKMKISPGGVRPVFPQVWNFLWTTPPGPTKERRDATDGPDH